MASAPQPGLRCSEPQAATPTRVEFLAGLMGPEGQDLSVPGRMAWADVDLDWSDADVTVRMRPEATMLSREQYDQLLMNSAAYRSPPARRDDGPIGPLVVPMLPWWRVLLEMV